MQLSKFQGQPKKDILLLETKKIADVSPDYDNTSNYGKKNDVMESCTEFNEDHILFQQFLQKKQP